MKTMNKVSKYMGKILLAKNDDKILGLIVGLINNEDENTYDFKAPKRGRVIELIVSKNCRYNGVGKQLLDDMETYFKSIGCQGVLIDFFCL